MKQIYVFLTAALMACTMHAQEDYTDLVQIGDNITIGEPTGSSYQHIDVPRKNFIIKRGGIANISSLNNLTVTVTDINYGENPKITFKRSNNQKFFRVYKTMTASLNGAIASGELRLPKMEGKGSIVR
ncbi:hypothetical protein [Flagellimonas flava]|uniref:Auto-transporter adhesin head GIN domain-containing protein n=1 Tax=Flagellimonas flava TaxID=570519 RepID=A0A1M5KFE9_9FLAO|nr:hypothetical protein [Allomuricauda flava]SHG51219.1 hypothetical protein SAMN04488116_1539 [Allomuricauda flava]